MHLHGMTRYKLWLLVEEGLIAARYGVEVRIEA